MNSPDFNFNRTVPQGKPGAIDSSTAFVYAVIERLDYICEALHELTKDKDGSEKRTQA